MGVNPAQFRFSKSGGLRLFPPSDKNANSSAACFTVISIAIGVQPKKARQFESRRALPPTQASVFVGRNRLKVFFCEYAIDLFFDFLSGIFCRGVFFYAVQIYFQRPYRTFVMQLVFYRETARVPYLLRRYPQTGRPVKSRS